MATTHQFITEWSPQRFIDRGADIDENLKEFIIQILQKKQHPEQAYKSCMGVLSMEKKVGRKRLINACIRAREYGLYSYMIIQRILDKGLDKINGDNVMDQVLPKHQNIRGKDYYQ